MITQKKKTHKFQRSFFGSNDLKSFPKFSELKTTERNDFFFFFLQPLWPGLLCLGNGVRGHRLRFSLRAPHGGHPGPRGAPLSPRLREDPGLGLGEARAAEAGPGPGCREVPDTPRTRSGGVRGPRGAHWEPWREPGEELAGRPRGRGPASPEEPPLPSPPLPPGNLSFSFASARMPPPQPLGRSATPSLSGSGLQNLDSTSSNSSSRSFAILKGNGLSPLTSGYQPGGFQGQRENAPRAPARPCAPAPLRMRARDAEAAPAGRAPATLAPSSALCPRVCRRGASRGRRSALSLPARPRDAALPSLVPGCRARFGPISPSWVQMVTTLTRLPSAFVRSSSGLTAGSLLYCGHSCRA